MIGDNLSDIKAGVKCKGSLLIAPERAEIYELLEKKNIHPDHIVKDLLSAAEKIEELEGDGQERNKDIPIMIVAAGVGSRLQDITGELPKCLVPVHGKPLIQYQVEEFVRQGFCNIIFCLGYQNTHVTKYFQDGEELRAKIRYSIEPFFSAEKLLGTAGAVKYGQKWIDNDIFVVFYGDNITTLDFKDLIDQHRKNNAFTTIVVRSARSENFSSIITLGDNGKITNFIEKPSDETKDRYKNAERFENNGIYIFDKKVFNYITADRFVDFAKEVIPKLVADNKRIFGYVCKSFFKELGRTAKFEVFLNEYKDQSFMIQEHEKEFENKA